jgi:G3E family GTPase
MNPNAKIMTCVRGEIPEPLSLIGSAEGLGAADWGILDEHRKLIKAIEDDEHKHSHSRAGDSHSHDHDHHHEHSSSCSHPSHQHDHTVSHGHHHEHTHTCTDPTHDHSHTCTDPTHDHSHDSHPHDHHNHEMTTAEERFGITSFVYRRRRPFHPPRFTRFLQSLGTLSVKGVFNMVDNSKNPVELRNPDFMEVKRSLLRSKGFIWMATSKSTAFFISHAGQYLDLVPLGRWWSDINEKEWPKEMKKEILEDFDGPHGDRRQELVFIGQFAKDLNKSQSKETFIKLLDDCLLNDEEMKQYEELAKKSENDDALLAAFDIPFGGENS